MKRFFLPALSVATLVVSLLSPLGLAPSFAASTDIRTAADDALAAAEEFVVLAGNSAQTGKVPRETDLVVKHLLDRVFDMTLLASKQVTVSDIDAVSTWHSAVIKVSNVYILAATGRDDLTKLDADLLNKINGNIVTFMPEMGRYMDAQLPMYGANIDVLAGFASSSDISATRSNLVQTMNGTLSALMLRGVTDRWRNDRLLAMKSFAPKAGKFVDRDQCRTLRTNAAQVAQILSDPQVKSGLQGFGEALACPA